jgi:hypothetical protein
MGELNVMGRVAPVNNGAQLAKLPHNASRACDSACWPIGSAGQVP